MTTTTHRIVVLGAGYTGMLAAIRLARRTRKLDVAITLVNPSARFTERLRMHQIAAGQELAHHDIPEILDGTGIEFVQGRVTAIDPAAQRVQVDGAGELAYDELVYALGSTAETTLVPGVAEHAMTLDDPRRAHEFAGELATLAAEGGSVAVCGGGLTGIEAAAEIAESHPGLRVTLISSGEPGAMMGDKARTHLNEHWIGSASSARSACGLPKCGLTRSSSQTAQLIGADLILWTTGVRVSPLATEAGIATDSRGLIVVDPTLSSVSHPDDSRDR